MNIFQIAGIGRRVGMEHMRLGATVQQKVRAGQVPATQGAIRREMKKEARRRSRRIMSSGRPAPIVRVKPQIRPRPGSIAGTSGFDILGLPSGGVNLQGTYFSLEELTSAIAGIIPGVGGGLENVVDEFQGGVGDYVGSGFGGFVSGAMEEKGKSLLSNPLVLLGGLYLLSQKS